MASLRELAAFKARIQAGTTLVCVENTYSAAHGFDRSGLVATIVKAGKNVHDATMNGKTYRMSMPTRASDVVALSEDTITYKVGRDDHTVTWRIVLA